MNQSSPPHRPGWLELLDGVPRLPNFDRSRSTSERPRSTSRGIYRCRDKVRETRAKHDRGRRPNVGRPWVEHSSNRNNSGQPPQICRSRASCSNFDRDRPELDPSAAARSRRHATRQAVFREYLPTLFHNGHGPKQHNLSACHDCAPLHNQVWAVPHPVRMKSAKHPPFHEVLGYAM